VEQEVLTLLEHLNLLPVISSVRVAQSLVFCVMFGRSLLVLLAIVLSVLLPFSTSDYPFGIFNFSCIDMMKKADN
jgi:hypothetical protein